MTDAALAPPDVLIGRGEGVIARTLDGETILYAGPTKRVLVLDRIATAMWDLTVSPVSLHAVCDELAASFTVDVATVATDLRDPLNLLLESGALVADVIAVPAR